MHTSILSSSPVCGRAIGILSRQKLWYCRIYLAKRCFSYCESNIFHNQTLVLLLWVRWSNLHRVIIQGVGVAMLSARLMAHTEIKYRHLGVLLFKVTIILLSSYCSSLISSPECWPGLKRSIILTEIYSLQNHWFSSRTWNIQHNASFIKNPSFTRLPPEGFVSSLNSPVALLFITSTFSDLCFFSSFSFLNFFSF